ncbi:MAG: single-stranded-DNA-specific exonuclease RecJ [Eubacteriales bacterium]|nr:single-stranded-DNA-specific exonuclease RecJ [Eubacteriales bacterium]
MLIQKEWKILDEQPGSAPLPERILQNRQLGEGLLREQFLHPKLEDLHDPFLLPDMAAACRVIESAIERGLTIVIHGDYDVDGLTATALLVRFFRQNGIACEPLIPDRLVDGYGLSESSVERTLALDAGLLITVDCGVTSVAAVAKLEAAGVAVVITDHHECPDILPQARAVVNPKRHDSTYPTTSLSGVGVTFKLIQALCQVLHVPLPDLTEYALVALGTVADVVPLLDENRILVRQGLQALNRHLHIGLTELLSVCVQSDRVIDASTIGYTLAPRLNAAGRLGAAMPALELLLTDDRSKARELALELQDQNGQRQALEAAILAEATAQIESSFDFSSSDLIILAREGWHTGVVGIVCSRLVDLYHRPVIVLGGEGGRFKGSARTCGNFDILEAIRAGASHTVKFGGHRKAAGIEVAQASLDDFCRAVNAYAAQQIDPLAFRPEITADALVTLDDLTEANALALQELAPFGESNRQPLLVCRNLTLLEWRLVGNGKHVRISASDGKARPLTGIAFNFSLADDLFAAKDQVDLLFALELNEFNGRRTVQLQIRDIHPSLVSAVDRIWSGQTDLFAAQPDLQGLARMCHLSLDQVLPDRDDYVMAFQYLRTAYADHPVQTDLSLLARRIARSYNRPLNAVKLAQILRVFAESRLLTIQHLGRDRVRIALSPAAQNQAKVRLSDAPTYQYLKAQGGLG